MSCHACQEAEATEFRLCGHQLCGGCVAIFVGGCISPNCAENETFKYRLPIEDCETIERFYQDDAIRVESKTILAIETAIADHEKKLAELRSECEKVLTTISQHSKMITASIMREQILNDVKDSPSAQKLTNLPTPKLIFINQHLDNSEVHENIFSNGSVLECRYGIEGVTGRGIYKFALRNGPEGGPNIPIGTKFMSEGCWPRSELLSLHMPFENRILVLRGFKEDPETFLLEENTEKRGQAFTVGRNGLLCDYESINQVRDLDSFIKISQPVAVGYRFYSIKVGRQLEKEFLMFADTPNTTRRELIVFKDRNCLVLSTRNARGAIRIPL